MLPFSPRAGGGGISDAGMPDGGDARVSPDGGPTPCGVRFTDDFDDPAQDPFWEPNSFQADAGGVSETNGELLVTLASEAGHYSGYLSDDIELTNTAATVRVVEIPNPATSAQAFFKYEFPYPDSASLHVEGGTIRARLDTSGSVRDLAEIPFEAASHRFFRLRHEAGTLDWQLSADGLEWTTLASEPGLNLSTGRVGIVGGTFEATSNPGVARFDDLVIDCL